MSVVLVVEDNSLVVDAMRVLLESGGHDVVTAGTVADTIAQVRERLPVLVLLDLTLPDGSGLDALREYAGTAARKPITVALTGHDDPGLRKKCLEAGCREVLLKPVPARELMAHVNGWMAEAREAGDA